MDAKTLATQILDHATQPVALELTPQQGKFLTCLLAAFLEALPGMLLSLVNCLAASPPSGDYKPGDRDRC